MKRKHLFLVLLLALATGSMTAQPGTLDPNFAGDGILFFQFGSDGNEGSKVVVDDNGTIWVAGVSYNSASQMGLAKILPDGTPDVSFNFDGAIGVNVEGNEAAAYNLAIQPDGKILLVGWSELNDGDFAVGRINPDGSVDNTFGGGDGRLNIDFALNDVAQAVAVQPDGKILVIGYTFEGGFWKIAMARLNQDGTLDLNFAGDGKLTLLFDTEDAAFDLELLPDGKILLGGYSEVTAGEYDLALFRLNPDGSLDTSFGTNGRATLHVNSTNETALSMAMQADGKIVLAGWSGNGIAIARFMPDGSPDNSFSFDGVNYTQIETYSSGNDLVIQPDGRIVVVGNAYMSGGGADEFCAVRYMPDGLLDSDFGDNGILSMDLGEDGKADVGKGVDLQPDGKLVIVGTSYPGNEMNMAIVRILSGLNVGVLEQNDTQIQTFVYPNPVQSGEQLRLEYELLDNTELQISLADPAGREQVLFLGNRLQGEQTHELKLPAGITSGVYFLHLRTESGFTSIRIVIQ